jgi:hypothetical protein
MSILINSDTWTGVCYAWSSDKEESIIGQHIINRHSLQSRVKNSRIKLTFRPNKTPRTYEVEFKVQPNPGFDVCLGTDWSNEDRDSGGNIDKNKRGRQACSMYLTNESSEKLCCHLDLLTITVYRPEPIPNPSSSSTSSILSTSTKAYRVSESS